MESLQMGCNPILERLFLRNLICKSENILLMDTIFSIDKFPFDRVFLYSKWHSNQWSEQICGQFTAEV